MTAVWRVLLVAGGALVSVALGCSKKESGQSRPTSAPSASTARPAARPPEHLPALQRGDKRTYTASLGSEARIDPSVLTQFDLKAELEVRALEYFTSATSPPAWLSER